MKINKYVNLIKKRGSGLWTNTKKDGVFLGTSASIYKADGLPIVGEIPQIQAILDLDMKQKTKVNIRTRDEYDKTDIMGYDLSDGEVAGEIGAKRTKVKVFIGGNLYGVLTCDDGEMLFFDEEYLNPLADILKDEISYISYSVRHHTASGNPYIVVKNGFMTVAMIMPMKVLSDDYISDLHDFELMCINQLNREKARARAKELEEERENGRQTTLDYMDEESEKEAEESDG